MNSILRSTSLFYWKDEPADLKEVLLLAVSNMGLYFFCVALYSINSEAGFKISETIITAFLSCILPLFSSVVVILMGYEKLTDDSVARISRTVLFAWLLSLFAFLHNAIYGLSITWGPWRNWLGISNLDSSTQNFIFSLAYGFVGPLLLALWTCKKCTAQGWDTGNTFFRNLFIITTLVGLMNSALFYGLLFDPQIGDKITTSFSASTKSVEQ
ncbi:MAG: hypothetical protein SFU85_02925 [Candidatus Methylacidiphilales bacterium]|nr:hypothetical protein [Candidatus Methylacidiphilales bacterium]